MALGTPVSKIVEQSKNPLLGKHKAWERIRLGDIATIQNGYAFKSDQFSKDEGIHLIRIRDVGKDTTETKYRGDYDSGYIVEPGDLLIGMDGDFNCARWHGPRGLLNQRVCRIALTTDIYHPKLLDYALPGYLKAINEMTSSVTVKHLSSKTISEIPLPLPPKKQQEDMVAEIEKQFSRLDEGVANLKRIKTNLKRYKAAVLKAAVEGKLTETWRKAHPDVEPASKLLDRILTARRDKMKGKKKYKEPFGLNISALPLLPNGWIWAPLEAISEAIGGFAFESKKFSATGLQVLKMANIRMGHIDLSQKPSFIQDVEEDSIKRYGLKDGDLVITLTGTRKKQDYGYVAVVKNPKGLLLNQRIARLRPTNGVLPQFLALTLQSEDYRNRFFAQETGNVGQGNVGMGAVTKVPITLAPFPEQQQIVSEVERRLSVIEELEATVEGNLTRANRLRQAVLRAAFSGALSKP